MMKRSLFSGSFLVVEGVTDGRLYGKFIDKERCEIVVAHSKDNVKGAVNTVFRRRSEKRTIGIVDGDIDHIKQIEEKGPLFSTDRRDSETVMIESEALDHILTEYGDRDKIDAFVNRYGDIRDALTGSCYHLGLLMYVSEVKDYGLYFKEPDFPSFVNKKSLIADKNAMIESIVANSPNSRAGKKEITEKLEKAIKEDLDPWDVCRGHDMLSVLALALRETFGSYNCRYIKPGEVAGALRLAYDKEAFRLTGLFANTSEWCSANDMNVWSF